jgi:hypothetical protein
MAKAAMRRKTTAKHGKSERFLLLLASGNNAACSDEGGRLRIKRQRLSISPEEADELIRRDLAAWRDDGTLAPTEAGFAWARRSAGGDNAFRDQHGDVVRDAQGAAVELAESPLLWLHRRRDADGNRLIGDAMFAAGERLRADFTFGNMTPRVTLNWTAAVQGSRNPHGADPSESTLAARQRVRRAVERVGPELSGVLIDVCCFLKRLEDVERDRRWPARSAKVILTLALQRLARHYGYSDCAEGRSLRKAG